MGYGPPELGLMNRNKDQFDPRSILVDSLFTAQRDYRLLDPGP